MSFEPGSQVMVQWSDGNQYAAQVVQYQSGHVLVGFPNGQQQWVGEQHVSQAGPVGGYPPVESDSYAHQEMAELQQLIARVEGQGVPLCGVDPNDPATLWRMVFAIDERGRLGIPRELAVCELGFSSEEHFDMVMGYVQAKWSYLGTDDEGRPTVLQRPEYQDAIARASIGQMMDKQAAAASADPGLLAPVDGVTIEQWAQASVLLGSLGANASLAEMHQKLAEIGLDKATYDNATAGWTAKMQGDTTGAISMAFADAFGKAQSGAMTAAGGSGGGGAAGGASDGPPCTFEHYVEIGAAMGAWSEQGFDVNAKLQEEFGIDAMGYSRYSTYWGMKMATDMQLMAQQQALDARFREKYAGADLDADLVL